MPSLPIGQTARDDFPRFGLTPYAQRFPARPQDRSLSVKLPGAEAVVLEDALGGLPRTHMRADFHCVTTWSTLGLQWGGVRFADFFERKVRPLAAAPETITTVVLRAQDGYRTSLPLEDLLADDVLLADELNGQPVSIEHGAPLRIIAPQHYGYKSLKHLAKLEFWSGPPAVRRGLFGFIDHPRARVSHEERGRWFPGWLLRRVYRPLIASTAEKFRAAMHRHGQRSGIDAGRRP